MRSARPTVLLFDLGGVLVDNVTFDELPRLLPSPISDGELRRRWLFSPSVQAFERGSMTTEAFADAFVAEWGLNVTPAQFLEAFAGWPRGPYPGALVLLDRLRGDYRLALLSNCNPVHWARLTAFRYRVDDAFSSHLLGLVKPELAIFHRVVDALAVSPEAIWFFDDSPANVEAAREAGMVACLTRGVGDVERALQALDRPSPSAG